MSNESTEAPEVPTVFDAPPAVLDIPSYTGAGVARGALLGLAICALIDVAEVLLIGIVRWSMDHDEHFNEYGEWTPPTWILDFETLLGGASLIALIATGITFLVWFSRAHAYASARAPISGGPVIAWFIPVASLWLPYQRVRDVWNVVTERPIGLVQVWWGLWLANTFFSRATNYEPQTWEGFSQLHTVMIGASVTDIATALLAARIVMTIDQAAHARMPATF